MFAARLVSVAVGTAALALGACSPPATESGEWEVMGTTAAAEVVTRRAVDAAEMLSEIRTRTENADRLLDPFSAEGGLGQLNRVAPDRFHTIDEIDLFACLSLALDYAEESDGAYDPTMGALRRLYENRFATANPPRPAEIDATLARVGWEKVTVEPEVHAVRYRSPGLAIDLGPVGRGCAVDWAARIFVRPGSLGGLIRIGGIFRAWQSPPHRRTWQVHLLDPRANGRELLEIDLTNRGVAVCGQPETAPGSPQADLRRLPLLDPRTGQPASSNLLAVVTTADTAADAAALCHLIYIAGSLSGTDVFRRMRRVEAALLVRADAGHPYLVASASLRGRIRLSDALLKEIDEDLRYLLPPESL
jgi:thiamine biosynthesis lipoprotein